MLSKIIAWLDKHLVPDWRENWNKLSIRGAGVFSAVVMALAAEPNLLLGIINFMPGAPVDRAIMAVAVGAVAFLGPWFLRNWNEAKPDDAAE